MRFIHITDSHIAADPRFSNYGHETLANLVNVVEAINALTFPVDFVLHTGDVVEDRSEAAYRLARQAFARLRLPIHYLAGNHDDADLLASVHLGTAPTRERLDYRFTVDGVMVVALDSRGPNDPAGRLTDDQLDELRGLCTRSGPPLVIAIHHPPLPLGSPWLDAGWSTVRGRTATMLLENGPAFLEAIAPARDRIRGVFFGHVHRAFQVMHDGILFCSGPSTFGQLLTWPDTDHPVASPDEPSGFSVVTVSPDRTVISQHAVARPRARSG